MKLRLLLLLLALAASAHAENEVGFLERFALAADREKALAELLPGTQDYYFYHALHFQNTRQAARLGEILAEWKKRHLTDPRRLLLENREALLAYETDPNRTLEFLRRRLSLRFDHVPDRPDQKPDLPAALDPAKVSRDAFRVQALRDDDLHTLGEDALNQLVVDKVALRPAQRRALLARVTLPTLPGLVELLAADLGQPDSPPFGEQTIHRLLLPAQLDQLAQLVPGLENQNAFVFARLRHLAPSAEEDVEFDPAAREAWLERAGAYARTLPAAFNSLKAALLYRRLDRDRSRGVYDEARLIEYLKLPRRAGYLPARRLERLQQADTEWVDPNLTFAETGPTLPPIGDDEPLVRDYFLHLFAAKPSESWERFAEWVRDTWLKPVYAEALLVRGLGDAAQLGALLSPADFQRLSERVDLDFPSTNPQFFAPADEVKIDVEVKNAPKLIVKVYELNALNYFLTHQRQLNTDLPLDGLVANAETTHSYDEAALRRVRRTFTFPELKGRRGAWVVEFIGGGRSSRALIRKGQWHLVQRTGPGGVRLTVLDETHQPVPDAAVWLDGRKFSPEAQTGEIQVPFTQEPGRRSIILADATGSFATLTQFDHHSETYRLEAQFHLEREQLLAGREAILSLRAALRLREASLPLSLLREATLRLTITTLDGITTQQEVKDLKLDPARVFNHRFVVPSRVTQVSVQLSGQIEQLSKGGEKETLKAADHWSINGIDRLPATFDGHLTRRPEGFALDLLGKNGEPLADRQVVLSFQHRDFETPLKVALRTDPKGRIDLGSLPGITRLETQFAEQRSRSWQLDEALQPELDTWQLGAGSPFEIPLLRPNERAALLEKRGATYRADLTQALTRAPQGALPVLSHPGLPAGDYVLLLPEEEREIAIKVTAGPAQRGWVFGPARSLELTPAKPLRIAKIETAEKEIVVTLANAKPTARVHVAATRFVPETFRLDDLARFDRSGGAEETPARLPNLFAAGRDIGDEYRYILERRYALKYPGNLLARPGLILNPWEKRSTDQSVLRQRAGESEGFTAGASPGARSEAKEIMEMKLAKDAAGGNEPNLDFLANPAPVLLDLVPDAQGMVRIDRQQLGDRALLQILATDLRDADGRVVPLPETPAQSRDLRLTKNLDPAKPFTQAKRLSLLTTGQTLTLADRATSEFATYDTLASVFALYQAARENQTLNQFAWILKWPDFSAEEKRAKYSEFACHELNFFLSRKDPAFFEAVILPYLRNKKEKTFLDDYLLGADLRRYLEPWRFGQLNAAERALLASRLPGEAAGIARHLRERWELLPPNPDEQNRLFEIALRGRALEDHVGIIGLSETADMRADLARSAVAATPPPFSGPIVMSRKAADAEAAEVRAAMSPQADAPPPAANFADRDAAASVLLAEEPYAEADAVEQRAQAKTKAYYRRLGPTREWAENNYYRLPIRSQGPDLIKPNAFWRDFAAWTAAGAKVPFLSVHFVEAQRNFSEALLALAVLDLPFAAPKHTTRTEGAAFTLTAGGAAMVVHQEIFQAAPADDGTELLVSQNFYREGQRHRQEGNEIFDRYVTDEFLAGEVYVANVVVTNPTSAPQKLEILLQIPQGSLPVRGARATDSRRVHLAPFTTQNFEYAFYFPTPPAQGATYPHYPVQVARGEKIVGAAKPFAFPVVGKLTQVDKKSWDYVSQHGSEDDVFAYLEQNNIERLDLARVAWRCRQNADFFRRLTTLLAQRHRFDPVVYSYAVEHRDTPALREWLRHRNDLASLFGPRFESPLLRFEPVERRTFEQLDYAPLINPRIHRLGSEYRIANSIVLQQYHALLTQLTYQPVLEPADALAVTGFLFLQDRVEEALARFQTIQADALPTRLQYDYFRCYAAFYQADLAAARGVANQYANHPVERWRSLFREVLAQLDAIEGKAGGVTPDGTQPNREHETAGLATAEGMFDFTVDNRTIELTWQNVREVTVNYYLVDPEFSFSSNPFVGADSSAAAIIKPTRSVSVPLPAGEYAQQIPLPAEFARANVLVEVVGAGQRKTQTYHANSLTLSLAENYGRLEVRDQAAGKPVPKAYVKVYARLHSGVVRFYKDGYTDLRGKFDYASLNSRENPGPIRPLPIEPGPAAGSLDSEMLRPEEFDQVARFSVLVLSEANGALVREVDPPRG